jgi:hypothetical protein
MTERKEKLQKKQMIDSFVYDALVFLGKTNMRWDNYAILRVGGNFTPPQKMFEQRRATALLRYSVARALFFMPFFDPIFHRGTPGV